MVEFGQMRTKLNRMFLLAGISVVLSFVMPNPVATGPSEGGDAEFRGACYCRAMGQLKCIGVVTQAACNKECAESLCDDWFWMERLTCWNWGYGG